MATVTHLRALQALEQAIRCGSMKEAAKALAITPAALGQRIRALEDYLGYDLLVRGRSGIRPTRELEAAVAHLSAGFRELETVTDILDFQRVHEVHITADTDWAELWLRPRIPAFKEDNPNTLFCINGTGDVPVRLGEADCDIRFSKDHDASGSDLLFNDYLLPVSSPVNTERVASLPEEVRLEGFPLLHLDCYTADGGAIGWPEWIGMYGYRKTAPGLGIRYRRVMHALEAVYADSGFLLCGLALIKPQVDDGTVRIPFPIEEGAWSDNAYRVAFRQGARRREQIERFRQWLLDEAGATRAELEGIVGDGSPAGMNGSAGR